MSTKYRCPGCKRDLPPADFDPRHVKCKTCIKREVTDVIQEEILSLSKE